MMIREFLETLTSADIKVWAEGDALRCNAPKGVLTPELQNVLKTRKAEVLAFLRAGAAVDSALVPIQPKGSRPPFFGIPGHNGDVFCYVPLAQHLGEDQPFYGLQPPGLSGERAPMDSVAELAARYVREMRDLLPEGPYFLGGYCAGGTVAFEVAQQLAAQGSPVALLAMFESAFPTFYLKPNQIWTACRYLVHRIPHHTREFVDADRPAKARYIREKLMGGKKLILRRRQATPVVAEEPNFKAEVAHAAIEAVKAYRPGVFQGRVHLFRASEESRRRDYIGMQKWAKYASQGAEIHIGPDGCVGSTMLREPFVEVAASQLKTALDRAQTVEQEPEYSRVQSR